MLIPVSVFDDHTSARNTAARVWTDDTVLIAGRFLQEVDQNRDREGLADNIFFAFHLSSTNGTRFTRHHVYQVFKQ